MGGDVTKLKLLYGNRLHENQVVSVRICAHRPMPMPQNEAGATRLAWQQKQMRGTIVRGPHGRTSPNLKGGKPQGDRQQMLHLGRD